MIKISAFADEISDDLDLQIKTLLENQVGFIELRGVWGKNVLDLNEAELRQVKLRASDSGLGFSAVGSPIGKFPLDGNFADQIEALKKAITAARIIEAPYIRMFSFFIPPQHNPADYRPQVLDWIGRLIQVTEPTGIVLAHENEKGIYGDTGDRCLDLYTSLQSPSFTAVFDFANFVQCGQRPYQDCWLQLRKFIRYFHIKDAQLSSGKVVPAGMGDGDVKKILQEALADGFQGFLTLEPHLSLAEASYGKTSPELFHTAVTSLNRVLSALHRR